MIKTDLVIYLTWCFIAYELLKLPFLKTYWNVSLKRRMFSPLSILEYAYLGYSVMLFFVGYWYVGLLLLIVAVITGIQISDDIIERTKFNKQIRKYLFADGVASILFLAIIIIKELLK